MKGATTKEFYPRLARRLEVNLNVTKIMTDHGSSSSYLHRLRITRSPECPCKHGTQTVDHQIFQCNGLKNEREILKNSILTVGKWPAGKSELTSRNLKQFIRCINSMDLEKLNHSREKI